MYWASFSSIADGVLHGLMAIKRELDSLAAYSDEAASSRKSQFIIKRLRRSFPTSCIGPSSSSVPATEDPHSSTAQTSTTQTPFASKEPDTTPSLPLTKTNLRRLQYIMSGDPVTPSQKSKSGSRSTTAVGSASGTPPNQKLTTKGMLSLNGMRIEHITYDEYPALEMRAGKIIGADCRSCMQPESAKRLERLKKWYLDIKEDTFKFKWWGKLFKDGRQVRTAEEGSPTATTLNEDFWTSKSWDLCGLDESWDMEFRKDSLSKSDVTNNPAAKLLIEQNERVKNPKPDICYGVRKDFFTKEEEAINNVGGTALVYATRNMVEASGVGNLRPGPDMDTFVFSLALIPNLATLYLHWAEFKDSTTVLYRMNEVTSYRLKLKDEKAKLRHDVNNILEWMLLEWLAWITTVLDAIHQRMKTTNPPTLPLAPSSLTKDTSLEEEVQSEAGGVQLSPSVGSNKRQMIGQGVRKSLRTAITVEKHSHHSIRIMPPV
ncbi:MAG: hypothetical protein Q9194_006421 [Teloschistes cf. exilis]